jgi:hypothetical protein
VSKLSGILSQLEQAVNIKFTCKLEKSVAEMLQALRTVWVCGQGFMEDKPHGGRPSTSVNAETILKMKRLVHTVQWIIMSDSANGVGVLYASAGAVLTGTIDDTALFKVFFAGLD